MSVPEHRFVLAAVMKVEETDKMIDALERETIYQAMEIMGIDRETTDAYLFLLMEGSSPVEKIPVSPHRKMRVLQHIVTKQFITVSRGGLYTAKDAEIVLRGDTGRRSQIVHNTFVSGLADDSKSTDVFLLQVRVWV